MAKVETKKFYWLKLKRDFFKRHDIQIIEAMPNGKDYILFYLKMLLESIDHEGELRFSNAIPYNEQMLSVITNTNVDIVRSAMKVFADLDMLEIFDDRTIYMAEVAKLIGSETAGAERVRRFREQRKALQCNTDVTNCNTEIEIEKDIEYRDKERGETESADSPPPAHRCDYSMIQSLYNQLCPSLQRCTMLSEKRKTAIRARISSGKTVDDFEKLFRKAEASSFLKGANNRNWRATFDWLICDSNMAKVLDGNYDDTQKRGNERTSRQPEEMHDMPF